MKNNLRGASLLVVASAMVACGGGDDAICSPLGTSGEIISQSTVTQLDQPSRAYDGDLSTSATLYSVTGTGDIEISAKGQAQQSEFAGVLLKLPSGQQTQVSVETRNNGSVVSSGAAGTQSDTSQICPGTCQLKDGQTFLGIRSSGTYDEIRATISFAGTTESTYVVELCSQ